MISIIVVIGKNREIGCDNGLLWNLPSDLKHFKEITTGHTVVMGRKTFESIGHPLPNRHNIVLTSNHNYKADGVEIKSNLEEALEWAKNQKDEIFIIGGGQIYARALLYANKLYLTVVDAVKENADTFFPDYSEFSKTLSEEEHEENGLRFKFMELER